MALAQKVTELDVYNLSFESQQCVFELSKSFPAEEKYSLVDQIRRSSRSVGANICEAWRKRRYVAHFRSKLTDADGEAEETCHWLRTAIACGYVSQDSAAELAQSYSNISGKLSRMMADAETWCSKSEERR
jgi:four helix bundle protein